MFIDILLWLIAYVVVGLLVGALYLRENCFSEGDSFFIALFWPLAVIYFAYVLLMTAIVGGYDLVVEWYQVKREKRRASQ